jgi:threonine dehydratase
MKFAPLSKTSSKVCKFYNCLFSVFIQSLEETRSITEPAGALALAGLKRHIIQNNLIGAQKKFVAVVSGANMNFDRLRFVADRAELGEGREALLSVDIPERPGRHVLFFFLSIVYLLICSPSFVALHSVIHPRAVTEFIYRYNVSGNRAHVLLSFKLQSNLRETEVQQVLGELAKIDMQGFDISDDELAKSHVRYMIGGCQRVDNERVFRFGLDDILFEVLLI